MNYRYGLFFSKKELKNCTIKEDKLSQISPIKIQVFSSLAKETIFSIKLTVTYLNMTTRKRTIFSVKENLPPNFAEEIIELELKIDNSCDIETVNSIVTYYSKAIEYYESIKDMRYKAYSKRLQNLLLRKDVKNILQYTNEPKKRKNPLIRTFTGHSMTLTELRGVENAMKEHTNESLNSKVLIQENLKKQDDMLETKVKERRDKIRSRAGSIDLFYESDICGGIPNMDDLREFEESLEKIMEKYIMERLKRVQNIKDTYAMQISETNEMGNNEIIKLVIDEMKKNMNKEIEITISELDANKAKEIEKLRAKSRIPLTSR
ncbi:unnamed protein product [Blepharisma stoltei]|uniref:Uncharacterized protein n=1 Tax=Blepharisma stoltei TaxID=1481888 RepID=A0AAU9IB19_9CILI|nr:unnamed protein product [Blepharisma stoltei]